MSTYGPLSASPVIRRATGGLNNLIAGGRGEIAFTGTLSVKRDVMVARAKAAGFDVRDYVNAQTKLLVRGEVNAKRVTQKEQAATYLKIPIISEEEFLAMIGVATGADKERAKAAVADRRDRKAFGGYFK